MSLGLGSVLGMGVEALNASQNAIQTTGNNISNVNTPGYSRQAVRLTEQVSLNSRAGQIGQGVKTVEIFRYFDKFIEAGFIDKNASQARYSAEYSKLSTVETLFNESISGGIGSSLNNLFSSFNKLSLEPNNQAVREALLQSATTLTSTINNVQNSMEGFRQQMDGLIQKDVETVNQLLQKIADLNREINACTITGRNNANGLMDERDLQVRELSSIMDISIQDDGAGVYSVFTGAGYLLVQETIPYSLQFGGFNVDKSLTYASQYDGTMGYEGTDGYEYTVEVITGGTVDVTGEIAPPPGTATYRVSLDNGKTWLTNDDGSVRVFNATDRDHSVNVKDINLYFTDIGTSLTAGDKFTISPKNEVFWVSPTTNPVNISSQIFADGTDNGLRIRGGSLAGNLIFRDYDIGHYMDRLDAFAESVIWEVNRIHSQGSGLEKLFAANGSQQVKRPDVPLGSLSSGFHWADKLQSGNMSFAIYDAESGESIIPYPGIDVFSPENFDPSKHSLHDVINAINSGPAGGYLEAGIVDGKISLTAKQGFSFGIVNDTSGLAAGLGINTFFSGTDAFNIAVRSDVLNNVNLVNAGRINGSGEENAGDNITANALAALATKSFKISTYGSVGTNQTLSDYYGSIVSKVGADTASAKFSFSVERAMAQEYSDRSEEVSGVSLDEEMTNLIKFQSSYKAAAKLVTTADEMLQTLLSLKQ